MARGTSGADAPGPPPDTAGGVRGLNHLALVSADMERTVAFYRDVLGFALTMTLELPGGAQHFFFDIGNGASLAFFWFPDAPPAAPGISAPRALPGLGDATSATGSMNHVAFDVPLDDIDRWAFRLRDAGVECMGPVNHDRSEEGWSLDMHDGVFMRSLYFMDPDGLSLEFASWVRTPGPDDARLAPRGAVAPVGGP